VEVSIGLNERHRERSERVKRSTEKDEAGRHGDVQSVPKAGPIPYDHTPSTKGQPTHPSKKRPAPQTSMACSP